MQSCTAVARAGMHALTKPARRMARDANQPPGRSHGSPLATRRGDRSGGGFSFACVPHLLYPVARKLHVRCAHKREQVYSVITTTTQARQVRNRNTSTLHTHPARVTKHTQTIEHCYCIQGWRVRHNHFMKEHRSHALVARARPRPSAASAVATRLSAVLDSNLTSIRRRSHPQ